MEPSSNFALTRRAKKPARHPLPEGEGYLRLQATTLLVQTV